MKIKIITERMPWIGGQPRALNAEIEADAAEAQSLIDNGFAVSLEKPKSVRKSNADV